MTFERLDAWFFERLHQAREPQTVAHLVTIIDPEKSGAAVSYSRYRAGSRPIRVETMQAYARRWTESGRAPVRVVVGLEFGEAS